LTKGEESKLNFNANLTGVVKAEHDVEMKDFEEGNADDKLLGNTIENDNDLMKQGD
jgi:hypothetical protein